MMARILAGLMVLSLTAVAYGEGRATERKAPATNHAGLEQMKKLAGTWLEMDKDGKATDKVMSVVKVIGGNVVHETLFPGQPHEMVSVYLVEKGELLMTHYCVLGNQPQMKADPKSAAGTIRFEFVGGTNLDPAKDKHMHEGTLTIVDNDHIEWSGSCWEGGKPCPGPGCGMKLVRKK